MNINQPTHLLPNHCYICGGKQHPATRGHILWVTIDGMTYRFTPSEI